VAPQLEVLFNVTSDRFNPVKGVTIRGVTLTQTRYTYMVRVLDMPTPTRSTLTWFNRLITLIFVTFITLIFYHIHHIYHIYHWVSNHRALPF